jgi:DnaJ like chaperone protein
MGIIGKVLGGAIGFAMGGPLGAVAGAVFGHAYDSSKHTPRLGYSGQVSTAEQSQITFFVAAFSMLAKLTKSDGTISDEEIRSIENFMARDLHLSPSDRKIAVDIFHTAVASPETFESFAAQFYNAFHDQPQMLEFMIDILLRVSLSDGELTPGEEQMIDSAVRIFHINPARFDELKARYVSKTEKYYAILGASRTDSIEEIKKKYRKLVSEYHPDKIASKGLPEEFIKFANDKFREIQEAYDAIKKEKGVK